MIPVYTPYFTGKERKYVNACLDSSWISSRGEFVDRFETQFAEFVGAKRAITVANGTVALHLALLALGIKAGDEIIVPTLTYVASVNMIIAAGATPVFVDSLANTWQMDTVAIESAITPRTRGVMAVHLYGASCDMDALMAICRANRLYLIEDCAEAFGTYFNSQHVGTFGNVSTFSFFGNKTITTGEGGMVVSNDPQVADRAYHLKTQAVSPSQEYWHDMVGYNYRMTNICAAIGLAQIESAGEILALKEQIASWYDRYLSEYPVERQAVPTGSRHSWWLYSILVAPQRRDALRKYLRERQVETRPVFPPVHTFPHMRPELTFPVAERISAGGISLPSYPTLSESDVKKICSAIGDFLAESTLDEMSWDARRA